VQILVIISFIKLILLKIRVRNVKFQIYEWQCATASGAFRPNPVQVTAHFVYLRSKRRKNNETRSERATASGALPFVNLKFYVSHSYF
jgi:hypothetical protein